MSTQDESKLQVEPPMQVPNVLNVQHEGKSFAFNGWVGMVNLDTQQVFEFVDEEDITHIWVDVNGNFVCEEKKTKK